MRRQWRASSIVASSIPVENSVRAATRISRPCMVSLMSRVRPGSQEPIAARVSSATAAV
ncbi:hypothetical protein SANTM175S_07805 [Streptomyces antimycoticus]